MKALFDSDVLIRALNGTATAKAKTLLKSRQTLSISVITWMEVMAGTSAATEQATRQFLTRFQIFDLTPEVAEQTVKVRQSMRLKLPDAIVYATALSNGCTFVTYNTKHFKPTMPSLVIPV